MTDPVRSLSIDDVTLAYRSTGSGPAVLCLQGVGVAGDGWRPQVEALAPRYRVLTCDNRGVGGTPRGAGPLSIERMAADATAILDAEGIDRCHVVGHSMGGLIALAVALGAPARVLSLSLLCTFADGAGPTRPTCGRHDPIAPPAFGRAIAAGIPGARYVEFEDASHALTIQHADRINALLLDHLDAAGAPGP